MSRDPLAFQDAVESLAYWHRRRGRLPWYRRGARREASRMVATWERRVRRGVVRHREAAPALRLEAALLVARASLARWTRRAGVAALAMLAMAALLAGASFAALDALLRGL